MRRIFFNNTWTIKKYIIQLPYRNTENYTYEISDLTRTEYSDKIYSIYFDIWTINIIPFDRWPVIYRIFFGSDSDCAGN